MIDLSALGPIARELAVLLGLALAGFALWRNILTEVQRAKDHFKKREKPSSSDQLLKPNADEIKKYKVQTFGQPHERSAKGYASNERPQTTKEKEMQRISRPTGGKAGSSTIPGAIVVFYVWITVTKAYGFLGYFIYLCFKILLPVAAAYLLFSASDTLKAILQLLLL